MKQKVAIVVNDHKYIFGVFEMFTDIDYRFPITIRERISKCGTHEQTDLVEL